MQEMFESPQNKKAKPHAAFLAENSQMKLFSANNIFIHIVDQYSSRFAFDCFLGFSVSISFADLTFQAFVLNLHVCKKNR